MPRRKTEVGFEGEQHRRTSQRQRGVLPPRWQLCPDTIDRCGRFHLRGIKRFPFLLLSLSLSLSLKMLFIHERDTQREAKTQAEGEAGPLRGARCGTGSRPERRRRLYSRAPQAPAFSSPSKKTAAAHGHFAICGGNKPLSFQILVTPE